MAGAEGARLARALVSLDGLSVGDAFGERFFGRHEVMQPLVEQRALPGEGVKDEARARHLVATLRKARSREARASTKAESHGRGRTRPDRCE